MRNGKRFLGGMFILLFVAGFIALKKSGPVKETEEVVASDTIQPKSKPAPIPLIQEAHQATNAVKALGFEERHSCDSFWSLVRDKQLPLNLQARGGKVKIESSQSLKTVFAEIQNGLLISEGKNTCILKDQHPLQLLHQTFLEQCKPDEASIKDQALRRDPALCIESLILYKMALIDEQSEKIPLSQIEDKTILAAKLFSNIGNRSKSNKVENIKKISERILEVDPDNVEAIEYGLGAAYDLLSFALENNESSDNRQAALQATEKFLSLLEQSHPDSDKILNTKINLARLSGDVRLMEKMAAELGETEQGQVMSNYYSAWAAHLQGDRQKMENYLSQISFEDKTNLGNMSLIILNETMNSPAGPEFIDSTHDFSFSLATNFDE